MVHTNVMLAGVQFNEIAQILVILLPILLFAIYKTLSKIFKHKREKLMLEKGIVRPKSSRVKGPRWIRSIYIGMFLILISLPFMVVFVQDFIRTNYDDVEFRYYLFGILPFAAGIAYLIRGILKRIAWKKVHVFCQNSQPVQT